MDVSAVIDKALQPIQALARRGARLAGHRQEWIKVQEALRLSREALAEKDAELAKLRGEPTQLDRPAQQGDEFERTAAQLTPYKGRPYTDFSEVEKSIYLKSALNLCGGPEAIACLIRAVGHVVGNGIPGAFVECGVFMGGNIEVMIRALQNLQVEDRDIYLYDTFAGMPQPEPRDDEGLDGVMKASWEAHRTDADGASGSDWMRATVATVRQRIEPLGYPPARLHFVKGLVESTIPGVVPERIAILRLDTDFYSSTKHELEHLYPRLMPGGILIIDDYGAMPGARLATDEYASENQLGWFLNRVDPHVRLVVKPTTS
jgi:O-methyltransferase